MLHVSIHPRILLVAFAAFLCLCSPGRLDAKPSLGEKISRADRHTQELARRFADQFWLHRNYEQCRALGLEMLHLAESRGDTELEIRGLVRLALIELHFGKWGNDWEANLKRCQRLAKNKNTVAYAEFKLFDGFLRGKFRDELQPGIESVRAAIRIIEFTRDDALLAIAYGLSAELQSFTANEVDQTRDAFRAYEVCQNTDWTSAKVIALRSMISVLDSIEIDLSGSHSQDVPNDIVNAANEAARKLLELHPTDRLAKVHLFLAGELPELEIDLLDRAKRLRAIPERSPYESQRLGQTLAFLIQHYLDRGEFEKARELCDETRECFMHSQNHDSLILLKFTTNMLTIELGDMSEEKTKESLRLVEEHAKYRSSSKTLDFLANTYAKNENFERAYFWSQESADLQASQRRFEVEKERNAAAKYWEIENNSRKQIELSAEQARKSERAHRWLLAGSLVFSVIAIIGAVSNFLGKQQRRRLEVLVHERTELLSAAMNQAQLANNAKSTFLAQMNHEIRNPLAAIVGYSSLLDSEVSEEDFQTIIQGIGSSSQQLLELVEGVLEMSLIENGSAEAEQSEFAFHELVSSIEAMHRGRANQKQIEFSCYVTEVDKNEVLIGPKKSLRQIVDNLISNALKFTEHGHVTADFRLERKLGSAGQPELHFVIADSGIGIPDDEQASAFEQFSKSSNNTSVAGSGLGLSICRQLTNQAGGTLQLNSELGFGTIVNVIVPVEIKSEANANDRSTDTSLSIESGFFQSNSSQSNSSESELASSTKALLPAPKFAGQTSTLDTDLANAKLKAPRILVVDDQKSVLTSICMQIEAAGFLCRASMLLDDTLETIEQWKPNLVLLDLRMPGQNGFDYLEKIRLAQPDGLRVVAMTGDATPEVAMSCDKAGFDGFLTKPFCIAEATKLLNHSTGISSSSSSRLTSAS